MQTRSFSEIGIRAENEDYVLSVILNKSTSIHIVADGMGGYEHGRLASITVAITIVEHIKSFGSMECIESLIQTAIDASNIAIKTKREQFDAKMGATVAGILFHDNTAYSFWVGDVRIYYFRNNTLAYVSKDHSIINELIDNGQHITPSQIEKYRHVVTKAVQGKNEKVIPEIVAFDSLSEKDSFIICTDGVHNNVTSSELERLFYENSDHEELVNLLSDKCKNKSSDNYSLILIDL